MELTAEIIMIVGFVASILSAGIKLLSAKFGVELTKFWMTVIVAAVSIVLAVLFNLPALPVYGDDPMLYVTSWLTLISGYVGFATLIYNLILDKVLDKLKLTSARFLPQ